MRQRRPAATAGIVNSRFALSSRALTRVVILGASLWMAWVFAQEAWTAHRLDTQAAELLHRNAALAGQNESYGRDIQTVQSGGASEEVARQNGYAKPGERVYVVASPTPGALAGPGGGATAGGGRAAGSSPTPVKVVNTSPGAFDGLVRWWSELWRHR